MRGATVAQRLRIYFVLSAPPAVYMTIWLISVYVYCTVRGAGCLYKYMAAQRLRIYIVLCAPPAAHVTI